MNGHPSTPRGSRRGAQLVEPPWGDRPAAEVISNPHFDPAEGARLLPSEPLAPLAFFRSLVDQGKNVQYGPSRPWYLHLKRPSVALGDASWMSAKLLQISLRMYRYWLRSFLETEPEPTS